MKKNTNDLEMSSLKKPDNTTYIVYDENDEKTDNQETEMRNISILSMTNCHKVVFEKWKLANLHMMDKSIQLPHSGIEHTFDNIYDQTLNNVLDLYFEYH